mgnify:CR=1 FL=1
MMEVTVWLAFAAGLISFISPCVLPLVPAYIGYMGGHTTRAAGQGPQPNRLNVFLHGVFFVMGFAAVFVLLGVAAGAVGDLLRSDAVRYIGGVFIILFGLHILGVYRWTYLRLPAAAQARLQPVYRALYADTRAQIRQRPGLGYLGSAFLGLVFAAGWSPCIGPILGSVLFLAGSDGDAARGGVLLLAYSLGLGIPFLVMAVGLDRMAGLLRRMQRHLHTVEIVSGVLLVAIGVLVFTGTLQNLSQLGSNANIALILETCVVEGWLGGEIPFDGIGRCADELAQQLSGATAEAEAAGAVLAALPADGSGVDWDLTAAPVETTVAEGQTVGPEIGQIAPNFHTQQLDGAPVTLEDFRGKTVLLNFWATWCGPCRIEMSDLQWAAIEYRDQLAVLPVNFSETPEQILRFARDQKLRLNFVIDQEARIQELYKVVSYPTTFIIAPDGTVVAMHRGPLTREQIRQYLTEAAAARHDAS